MGLLRLMEQTLQEPQRAWIRRQLETPGAILIEPWLDRLLDFSCQFEMEQEGLRRKGFVRMINDARGQYQSSIHSRSATRGWPTELARFVHGSSGNRMKLLFEGLRAFLEPRLAEARFRGPIGVDAMIFREPGGTLRLKPVVEINPRYTMGRLLIELMRQAKPGCTGRLDLVNRAALRRLGHDSFASYAAALREQAPPRFHAEGPRRLRGGAVCLNDPAEATQVLAVFSVD